MEIRFAEKSDLKFIVDIYNQAVRSGRATADLQEVSISDRKSWFEGHNKHEYPIYILEDNHKIIGWGSLSPYRKGREGLKETAEISYYIDYNYHGLGYGKELIGFMINDCKRLKIKNLFALMLEVNETSAKILEKFGFSKWGIMPNVANLNGFICGQLIYGINLNASKSHTNKNG